MTTLNELEALAKRDDRQGYLYATRIPTETILQMIALIRQLGDALQNHGAPYYRHGVPWDEALNALKEFEHE